MSRTINRMSATDVVSTFLQNTAPDKIEAATERIAVKQPEGETRHCGKRDDADSDIYQTNVSATPSSNGPNVHANGPIEP